MTVYLGLAAALVGFLAVGLLALGEFRNGRVGVYGLIALAVGVILAIAAAATIYVT
jgi:hypothetical protein